MVSRETIVTAMLVYLLIGSLVWVFLDLTGVIANTYRDRVSKGEPPTTLAMFLATALLILIWPKFVWGAVMAALPGVRR